MNQINKYKGLFCRLSILGAAFLISWVVVACYTIPQTGRSAVSLIGPSEEFRLGIQAFDEVKKKEKIIANTPEADTVQRVGKRIASVADKDIPHAKWEFVLFDNKEPNAFALPGGKVGVYGGILEITKDDAGLAAVMGHEIAHVAARHGSERMSWQLIAAGVGTGVSLGLQGERTRQIFAAAFGIGVPLAAILPHSREQESEADYIGLVYMAKAGYPPQEAVAFWERFRDYNAKKGGRPPEFLSTHPTDERRIADLRAKVPEAEVYYKTSGRAKS